MACMFQIWRRDGKEGSQGHVRSFLGTYNRELCVWAGLCSQVLLVRLVATIGASATRCCSYGWLLQAGFTHVTDCCKDKGAAAAIEQHRGRRLQLMFNSCD